MQTDGKKKSKWLKYIKRYQFCNTAQEHYKNEIKTTKTNKNKKTKNRRVLTKRRHLAQPACLNEVDMAVSNDLEEQFLFSKF